MIRSVVRFTSLLVALLPAACEPMGAATPQRPPLAAKWLERAEQSYKSGDFEDATSSIDETLRIAPHDDEARLVAARLALAHLDLGKVLKLTDGMTTSEAHGLRGRAHWYAGEVEPAGDELNTMLTDPAIKDPWARDVVRLVRKAGTRKPFTLEGGVVAAVEMPPAGAALIVPCEMEGEPVLTLVSTGSSEVVIDSETHSEPSWVSFKFADRIEVRDVPALTQDLSAFSRMFGAPIRALLGANLLRHTHATFDRRGGQFIIRLADPPSPPEASRLPLLYDRGGGMMMRMQVTPSVPQISLFYVDSSQPYSILMRDALWKKAGVDVSQLAPSTVVPNARAGLVPSVQLAGMSFPSVPGLALTSLSDLAPSIVDIDLGGVVGASMLEPFRITFTDDGRFAWVELDPTMKEDARR